MKYLDRFLSRLADRETGPKNPTDAPDPPTKPTEPPPESDDGLGSVSFDSTQGVDRSTLSATANLGQSSPQPPTKPTEPQERGPQDFGRSPPEVPTKPTEPSSAPGPGGSVGFVSDQSIDLSIFEPRFVGFVSAQGEGSSTFSPAGHAPPVASDPGPPVGPPYPWRVPLPGWPIPWRRAWGRRANELQDQGLSWWQAERQALAEVSRLKYSGGPPPAAVAATTTWDDLAALRWGPAKGDPTPGICIDRPDRGRMRPAMEAAADDPEKRAAIQSEDVCGLDNFLCDNEGDGDGCGGNHTLPLIRPLS